MGGTKADYFYKVTECAYSGFVALGASQSEDGDLTGLLKGGYDRMVAKFDSEGNLLKTVTIGGSSKDELRNLVETLDGGYIAVTGSNTAAALLDGESTDGDLAGLNSDILRDFVLRLARKTLISRDFLFLRVKQNDRSYGFHGGQHALGKVFSPS